MLHKFKKLSASVACCVLINAGVATPAYAADNSQRVEPARKIDLAIALDVSGSMSGLIGSAKQRLWDIVNELEAAQPRPELRLAILSYGNPRYGQHSGYVKIDLPFTSDLDTVNRTLFAFETNGGDEYVSRAVSTAVNELAWSSEPNALRIIFVAGNEAADQDPQMFIAEAAQAAVRKGIAVNTIYCGSDSDNIVSGWRDVAARTNGLYASIDQHRAAVANVATPMDGELAELNRALNETYIPYGQTGEAFRDNQLEQDENAGAMSPSAMASRVVTKAGRLYDNSAWDLVDAVKSGKSLAEFEPEELPAAMQPMNEQERDRFIKQKAARREALQAEIGKLDKERRQYITNERSRQAETKGKGLDEVMQQGLRTLAEQKGFSFDEG